MRRIEATDVETLSIINKNAKFAKSPSSYYVFSVSFGEGKPYMAPHLYFTPGKKGTINEMFLTILNDAKYKEYENKVAKLLGKFGVNPGMYIDYHFQAESKRIKHFDEAIKAAQEGNIEIIRRNKKYINKTIDNILNAYATNEFAMVKRDIKGSEFEVFYNNIKNLKRALDKNDYAGAASILKEFTTIKQMRDKIADFILNTDVIIGQNLPFDIPKYYLMLKDSLNEKHAKAAKKMLDLFDESKVIELVGSSFTKSQTQLKYVFEEMVNLIKQSETKNMMIDTLPLIRGLLNTFSGVHGTKAGFKLGIISSIYLGEDISQQGLHSAEYDTKITKKLMEYFINKFKDKSLKEIMQDKELKKAVQLHGSVIKTLDNIRSVREIFNKGIINVDFMKMLGINKNTKILVEKYSDVIENVEDIINKKGRIAYLSDFNKDAQHKIIKKMFIKKLEKGSIDIDIFKQVVDNMSEKGIIYTQLHKTEFKNSYSRFIKYLKNKEIDVEQVMKNESLFKSVIEEFIVNDIQKTKKYFNMSFKEKTGHIFVDIILNHYKGIGAVAVGLVAGYMFMNSGNGGEFEPAKERMFQQSLDDVVLNIGTNIENMRYDFDKWRFERVLKKKELFKSKYEQYIKGHLDINKIAFYKIRTSPDYKNLRKVPNPHMLYKNRNKHQWPVP